VDLDKYWASASEEFDYKLKPGTYSIEAQLAGRGVSQQEANLDVKGNRTNTLLAGQHHVKAVTI